MDNQAEVDKILQLCEDWLNTVIQPNGSGVHDGSEQKFTLDANIVFHDLTINEIQSCCVGLTNRLHYRHTGAFIDRDQSIFWSWIGQLFCTSGFKQTLNSDDIHAHVCGIIIPMLLTSNDVLFDMSIDDSEKAKEGYDFNLRKFVGSRFNILRYLSFPFLEACTRRLCANYITSDGVVINQFSISGRTYNVNRKCSSLNDLLNLLETSVAGSELNFFLGKIKDTINRITATSDPFHMLYSWRNQTLHGNQFSGIAGALFFNISILFLLELSRNNYTELSNQAYEVYKNSISGNFPSSNTYYNPDLLKQLIVKYLKKNQK